MSFKINDATKYALLNLAVILLAAAAFFLCGLAAILWLFDRETLFTVLWR